MNAKRVVLGLILAATGAAGGCDDPLEVEGPTPVASMEIAPAPAQLLPGDSAQLVVVLRAADGSVLVGRAVTWSSADTAVVAVSASGVVRARRPGAARVGATAEGRTAVVDLVVAPHPVAVVMVAPATLSLSVGGGAQLRVELRSASGETLEDRSVSWSTDDPRVATVSAGGLVSAVGPGSAIVTASVEGRSAQARVTVADDRPADTARFVIVSPNPASVLVGGGLLITADVRGATGGQVPGARIDAWRSEDATIATVSSTGVARGVSPGTVRIYARSGSVEGYTTLEVRPVPGAVQTYRLRWDDPSQVQLPVDTVEWQDPQAGAVRAHVYLRDATFTLDLQRGRYRQEFTADLAAEGVPVYLGRTTWSHEGQVAYVWSDGRLAFVPDGAAAPAFGAQVRPDGALRVEQSVRGGAVVAYTYVLVPR